MRIAILLVGLVLAERAVQAEDLGPFVSAPEVPAAPQCRAPKLLQRQPSVACGKNVYLVAWSDGTRQPMKGAADIYCARIQVKTGKCLDPKGILVCQADYDQGWPAVAFDGTNFLVVWQDFRNGKDYDIYAARVTEEGKVLTDGLFRIIEFRSLFSWIMPGGANMCSSSRKQHHSFDPCSPGSCPAAGLGP